jgi:predicted ATP-dependent serine protease
MENDVVIICGNCGATKLVWQTVCPTCQGTNPK